MTTGNAFCKIRGTIKVRRLLRMVASEKWWGYSNRYTLLTRGLTPSGVPGHHPILAGDASSRETVL
jgi:hypothetical protein